jgi:prephenate dehydratase
MWLFGGLDHHVNCTLNYCASTSQAADTLHCAMRQKLADALASDRPASLHHFPLYDG